MGNAFSLHRRTLLLASLAAAALPSFPADAAVRRELRYATLGLDTSDPHRHTGSIAVQQCYAEPLTSIADDGQVKPFLAEKVTVSSDGRTYTLKIRQGVKFHNGDVLTAEDVVANINRIREKIKGGWLVSSLKNVENLSVPEPGTVVIAFARPFAPFMSLMAELWILSPKSPGWDSTITQPIGTGPFRFGKWLPKVSLDAPAFADYWQKGLPKLAAVHFDLRDGTDKSLAIRSGDLDVAYVSKDAAEDLQRAGAAVIEGLKDSAWYFLSFNNRKPRKPFDDIRVRKALAHCIDKQGFMNFVGGSRAQTSNQFVGANNFYFDRALYEADEFKKPDLEKAKALLKEAGVDPSKHTIEFVSWQVPYAQIAVQMIRRLGFKVHHVALDDIGTQKRLSQYDWDLTVMSSGPRSDIYLRYVRLMSEGPNPVLWGGIQDPTLDKLIAEAAETTDAQTRRAACLKAFKRVMEKGYFYVIGLTPDLIAIRKGVTGFHTGFTWACHWADGGVDHADLKA